MNHRQNLPAPWPSPGKTLTALGALMFFSLWQPLFLLAAEQTGGANVLTGSQETLSLTTAIFKTIGALIIVIGLMLLILSWIKKTGMVRGGASRDGLIAILDSRMLAPKKQVSVLEVAGTYLVVGISEQQITLLATLEANDRLQEAGQSGQDLPNLPVSFAAALNKAVRGLSALKQKKEGTAHAE